METFLMIFGLGLMLAQGALVGATDAPVLEQQTQSFTIVLNGTVKDVTPLFGPVREAEWAPDWSPRFIQSTQGAQREGVVFTTTSGEGKDRIWLLTTYDVGDGRVEYVAMTPSFTVTEIKIHVVPDGEERCKATIKYRRSALGPEGNEEVAKLDAPWVEEQRIHWEMAINKALENGRHP